MQTGSSSSSYYSYLIRPDRSASPQLEDLCLGLAKIISDIDPGQHPDNELSPRRLAAFYRRLGGNYDTLFLNTSEDGLSFMYRTLGCFQSLQPTRSPFETPRIPCLTPTGFARWQTIQLLLSPQEHAPFLQKAVQIFDVPRPDGGYFPSHLPRECLPDRPDEAMEKWYRDVTGSLNQDNHMRRLKYSPAQSPYLEPQDRRDSYFANGHTASFARRSQNSAQDEEKARQAEYRRRSSVPDIPSPLPAGAERGSHWDPATRHQRKARSHSATRPVQHTRQRSHTTSHTTHHNASTPDRYPSRPIDSPSTRRNGGTPSENNSRPPSRPTSQQQQQHHQHRQRLSNGRPKSPSTIDESSGSEASSEASHNGRQPRKSDDDRASRISLLVPSFLRSSHKRRHSSETGVRKLEAAKSPTPLRPEYYAPKRQHVGPSPAVPQPQPVMSPSHRAPQPSGVRFRDNIFDSEAVHSAPDLPAQMPFTLNNQPPPPSIRYPEPNPKSATSSHPAGYPTQQMEDMSMLNETQSRESSSGSGTDRRYYSASASDWDRERGVRRKEGGLSRAETVSGVGGRKYANPSHVPGGHGERREGGAGMRVRGSAPTTVA